MATNAEKVAEMEAISNIAVIGAGGIGSEFARILDKLCGFGQVKGKTFTFYDDDIVEPKNLKHQNFLPCDVGLPKAALIACRFNGEPRHSAVSFEDRNSIVARICRFVPEDLERHDMFIVCVDNAKTRKIIFDHVYKDATHKHFIDMRCSGDFFSVYTKGVPYEEIMESLGDEPESSASFSCQREYDVAEERIQLGNFAVAPVGAQFLLNMFRGDTVPKQVFRRAL